MTARNKALEIIAWVSLTVGAVATILIGRYNKLPSRGAAPLPLKTLPQKPILQLELGRSDQSLLSIFMPKGADREQLNRNIADARIGNDLDTFLFIPAYTVLLVSLGLLLRQTTVMRTLISIAIGATLLAAICDWVENWGIASALRHLAENQKPSLGDAIRISNASIPKWGLLAAILLSYGVAAVCTRNIRWVGIGIVCLGLGFEITFVLVRYLVHS